jgi:hypothetical protein
MDQSLTDDRLFAKGIAVYPSSANASSTKASGSYTNNVSDVSFTLPSEQKAIENNIESNLNFSYADVDLASFTNTINNPSHQTKLEFKNVCALIQLTMPAQMPKVTEIVLTSNDKVALTGHGNMNYTNDYKQEVNGTVTVTDGGNVVLKKADGFKAGATYYAVVWPGTHNSGLTIEFKAEDGTVATKTTQKVTLTASKIKPYTFCGRDVENRDREIIIDSKGISNRYLDVNVNFSDDLYLAIFCNDNVTYDPKVLMPSIYKQINKKNNEDYIELNRFLTKSHNRITGKEIAEAINKVLDNY